MPRVLNNNNLIAVLDIGTSKTCCVLAYPVNEDEAVIVGAGSHQNTGVKKSEIVNLEATVDSVRHAVADAESFTNERIKTVVATACVRSLDSSFKKDKLDLGGRAVSQSDLDRLTANVQAKIPVTQNEILHCFPVEYNLDSRHSIADPRGLSGDSLSLCILVVAAPSYQVNDMDTVFEQSHLNCFKKVASPYAAGYACLTDEEKADGTAVIDLGAGSTGIGVFYKDQLVYTARIDTGGDDLTETIVNSFHTSFSNAERIKTMYGSALPLAAYEQEEIPIPLAGEDEDTFTTRVPRAQIVAATADGIENLFTNIRKHLEDTFLSRCQNFVLTGGGSQLYGINERAAAILGRNVRTGRPLRLLDKKEIIPPYAYQNYMNCIGMLHYTTHVLLKTPTQQRVIPAPAGNKFTRFFRWFLDNS